MNNLNSIDTISNLKESSFRYFKLKEFNNPEYDPRENPPERIFDKSLRLTKAGFTHSLTWQIGLENSSLILKIIFYWEETVQNM